MKVLPFILGFVAVGVSQSVSFSQAPYQSSVDFEKYARKLRESALLKIEPRVDIPTLASPLNTSERYPWKRNIVTTVFWCGEAAAQNNPVANYASSWDISWWRTYGGYDDPDPSARTADFRPARFVPQLNPFYYALPYNDVVGGRHKSEASKVIPWFHEVFRDEGKSVLKDRWICIRNRFGKECYAQWGDCGPFRTDHWEYVFGNDRPKPNLNKGAGLDVSPAVRDFLGISGMDVTDWRFVEWKDVPPGPWRRYGENNHWVQHERTNRGRVASASSNTTQVRSFTLPPKSSPPPSPPIAAAGGPRVELPTDR